MKSNWIFEETTTRIAVPCATHYDVDMQYLAVWHQGLYRFVLRVLNCRHLYIYADTRPFLLVAYLCNWMTEKYPPPCSIAKLIV